MQADGLTTTTIDRDDRDVRVERDMLISLQGGEANALVEEEKTPIVGRIKILVNSPPGADPRVYYSPYYSPG